jgi:signal-transduction protein with cAMP-binding, CBS, and nucleotidyltransferase domain
MIEDTLPELATSPTIEGRRAQAFPILTQEEIARLRRFATPRKYRDGDKLYEIGKPSAGMHVLLSGRVRVTGRDSPVEVSATQMCGAGGSGHLVFGGHSGGT